MTADLSRCTQSIYQPVNISALVQSEPDIPINHPRQEIPILNNSFESLPVRQVIDTPILAVSTVIPENFYGENL